MEKNNQVNVEQSSLKLDTSKYHVKKTNKGLRVLVFVGLILWAFINLFPIYWMFTFSLKTNEEIFGENVAGLPNEWKWENYDTAFWGKGGRDKKAAGNIDGTEEGGFQLPKIIRQFINSVIITVSTILISIFAAMMATFAMSRIQWKLSKWAYAMFMLGLTIPIHASLLPVYKTISSLGLLNTYTSLILPYLKETLEDLRNREKDPEDKWRARVVVVGSELDDYAISEMFENARCYVAADRYCFGSFPGRQRIALKEGEPALDQICRFYLETNQCPRFMSAEKVQGRRDLVLQLVKDYRADGIIYEQAKFCDFWGYERTLNTQVMWEEYGIPTLGIDREYVVQGSGQLATRIQAFMESLEIKKIQKGGKGK